MYFKYTWNERNCRSGLGLYLGRDDELLITTQTSQKS